ncbi:carboxypeptidase C prc1 [Quaeritorhiza haematococci]|nr:carboxypeptidase C prc1 [Quaeritorhiza haematococci]
MGVGSVQIGAGASLYDDTESSEAEAHELRALDSVFSVLDLCHLEVPILELVRSGIIAALQPAGGPENSEADYDDERRGRTDGRVSPTKSPRTYHASPSPASSSPSRQRPSSPSPRIIPNFYLPLPSPLNLSRACINRLRTRREKMEVLRDEVFAKCREVVLEIRMFWEQLGMLDGDAGVEAGGARKEPVELEPVIVARYVEYKAIAESLRVRWREKMEAEVNQLLERLEQLWQECHVAQTDRDVFMAKIAHNLYSPLTMELARKAIEELEIRLAKCRALYRLVEERADFIQKIIDFERSASDPKRLFAKSFQLVAEEKFRKTCYPTLLKMEEEIRKTVLAFEAESGQLFYYEGARWLDTMDKEISERFVNETVFVASKGSIAASPSTASIPGLSSNTNLSSPNTAFSPLTRASSMGISGSNNSKVTPRARSAGPGRDGSKQDLTNSDRPKSASAASLKARSRSFTNMKAAAGLVVDTKGNNSSANTRAKPLWQQDRGKTEGHANNQGNDTSFPVNRSGSGRSVRTPVSANAAFFPPEHHHRTPPQRTLAGAEDAGVLSMGATPRADAADESSGAFTPPAWPVIMTSSTPRTMGASATTPAAAAPGKSSKGFTPLIVTKKGGLDAAAATTGMNEGTGATGIAVDGHTIDDEFVVMTATTTPTTAPLKLSRSGSMPRSRSGSITSATAGSGPSSAPRSRAPSSSSTSGIGGGGSRPPSRPRSGSTASMEKRHNGL